MNSAIYTGNVRHRRFSPKKHDFTYRIFMPLLNLDQLPELLDSTRLWSSSGLALAKFNARDFFNEANSAKDIKKIVIGLAEKELPEIKITHVSMLANLRYFGWLFNPIVCYYCFDSENQLKAIVAQVTNTPWMEKHCYVIPCQPCSGLSNYQFNKCFHVSPFMPMEIKYHWYSNKPGERLSLHMENYNEQDEKIFDATLLLQHQEADAYNFDKFILLYPLMTLKVVSGIYWQALKLFTKGLTFFDHPNSKKTITTQSKISARK